ncbi:LRR receptor kinase BAK1 [Amborella trichopoda]|nr:LRR receptor kinase BAK1 [Amborella trichopoda]|eukprot:XP_020522919.1 LRR receptor kinase BAK1 [Amborella trichopoda]
MAYWALIFLLASSVIVNATNFEGEALMAQREKLVDPSNVLASWDSEFADPCQWFHVHCNDVSSVISLDLGDVGLSGTLVPELGSLGSLQRLYFYNNNLSGGIPEELGQLKNLAVLELENNSLTGVIPPSLATIQPLCSLNLSNNKLTGNVPQGLLNKAASGTLRLDLSNNKLTGIVPQGLLNKAASGALRLNVTGNMIPSPPRKLGRA